MAKTPCFLAMLNDHFVYPAMHFPLFIQFRLSKVKVVFMNKVDTYFLLNLGYWNEIGKQWQQNYMFENYIYI